MINFRKLRNDLFYEWNKRTQKKLAKKNQRTLRIKFRV